MPAKKRTTTESQTPPTQPKRLYRSESDRIFGGVAGGLGDYFNTDPTIIRIVFVLLTVFGGSGFLLYLVLWLLLPTQSVAKGSDDHIQENLAEMKHAAKNISTSMRDAPPNQRRSWGAIILIALGIIFIINNFGFFHIDFHRLWPIFLILLGLFLLQRR